jgi:hypothetical protein
VQVAAAQVCYVVAGGALHWAPEPGDPSGKLCLVGAGDLIPQSVYTSTYRHGAKGARCKVATVWHHGISA